MSALATRFTLAGDARCFAGEALTVELAFDDAGSTIDLTGREFAWTVYRASDREPMFAAAGEIVSLGDDHCVRFMIDGDTTDSLFARHRTGLRHEMAEIAQSGRDIWVEGQFSIERSAAVVAPVPISATVGAAARYLFDYQTRRVTISPRGAPGRSYTQEAGTTPEAEAERLAAIASAAAQPSIDALEQATVRADTLATVLSAWVPPGAVMNMGSPINLLLAGE